MIDEVLRETEAGMQKTIAVLKKELSTLRAGRANAALLDKVTVDYYGTPTPVNQLANISVPEARLLVIQPWDKSSIGAIEKAILKSELGITPTNDGSVIRLVIPPLTEERRKELVKLIKKYGEEAKVAVRNARRDANDTLKDLQKAGDISEDESKRAQEKVQKITDKYVEEVDKVLAVKEKEVLEF